MNICDAKNEWLKAATLEEIGELTARWIEGKLPYYPLYNSETIDEECIEIRQPLIFFNQNGFVTTFSQPAEELDSQGFAQRACVAGLAKEKLAEKIAALALSTNLLVFIFSPEWVDWEGGYHVPITIEEFQPFTWCGSSYSEELAHWENNVSERAIKELSSSWQVIVIDLTWGRKNFLWEEVTKVIAGNYESRYRIEG